MRKELSFERKVNLIIDCVNKLDAHEKWKVRTTREIVDIHREIKRLQNDIIDMVGEDGLTVVQQYVMEKTRPVELGGHTVYNPFQLFYVIESYYEEVYY